MPGEEALIQALSRSLCHVLNLRCFGHFKDNCKEQLKSVPKEVQAEFYTKEIPKKMVSEVFMQ